MRSSIHSRLANAVRVGRNTRVRYCALRGLFTKVTVNGEDVDFGKLRWSVLTSDPNNERMLRTLRDFLPRFDLCTPHSRRAPVPSSTTPAASSPMVPRCAVPWTSSRPSIS